MDLAPLITAMEAKKAIQNVNRPSQHGTNVPRVDHTTRLTSGLDGCNEQVARQQLCQSILETDFASKGFLQKTDEEMAEWCGHKEAVQGHLERFGVNVHACECFGER